MRRQTGQKDPRCKARNSVNPLLIRSIPTTSPEFGMARVP
jgi:hypothetical protein